MKTWKTLAKVAGLEGQELMLQERDGVFVIRSGGRELMSSAHHNSEEAMAEVGMSKLTAKKPVVLIGGLGLGYTVGATLKRLPPQGSVVVSEISEHVVEWNRGPLAHLAGSPLSDPRVRVDVRDVAKVLKGPQRFDVILLDVDNGPSALSTRSNQQLYEKRGVDIMRAALNPGGVLVVWSAGPDAPFLERLRRAGFDAQMQRSPQRLGGGASHVLFVAGPPPSTRRRSAGR